MPSIKIKQIGYCHTLRMDQTTTSAVHSTTDTTTPNPQLSAADELTKIARLKEQGILSEAEFNQMKQEILKKL